MNILNRENLLKKEKLEIEQVDLGNDEHVFVRQMTGRERDRFEQSLLKEIKDNKGDVVSYDRSLEDFRAKLAVVTLCDEEGKSLLRPEDYTILSQNMSAKRLEAIVNVAQRLNKISDDDKKALVKNSEAGLDDNSSSGCAEN
jgi:Fe2+ transport system protein B